MTDFMLKPFSMQDDCVLAGRYSFYLNIYVHLCMSLRVQHELFKLVLIINHSTSAQVNSGDFSCSLDFGEVQKVQYPAHFPHFV